MDQTSIPRGCEQIFVISQNVSNTQKEDLAWATYILLRNTNTIALVLAGFYYILALDSWNFLLAMRVRRKIHFNLDDNANFVLLGQNPIEKKKLCSYILDILL